MKTTWIIAVAALCMAGLATSATADPSYWNFSGPVTIDVDSTPGVDLGDTVFGRFWGDPVTNALWELRWWTNDTGSLASPVYLQTNFSGYTIPAVDPDYITAVRLSPLDSIVFDPEVAPNSGGDYFAHTRQGNSGTNFLRVGDAAFNIPNSLQFTITPAPQVPLPGAVLLGLLGFGYAGLKLRRSV